MKHSLEERGWQHESPITILRLNWAIVCRSEGVLEEAVKFLLFILWAQPYHYNHKREVG